MKISRKDFLKAGAAIVTSAVALQACGDDEESTTPTGPTTGPTTSGGGNSTGPVTVGGGSTSTSTSSSNGGSGGTSGTGGSCAACATVMSTIGTNHTPPHTITVPLSDVMAGADVTYDIQGDSAHAHSVLVTGAMFATLQACGTVMVTSTGGQHDHVVTISCAA